MSDALITKQAGLHKVVLVGLYFGSSQGQLETETTEDSVTKTSQIRQKKGRTVFILGISIKGVGNGGNVCVGVE